LTLTASGLTRAARAGRLATMSADELVARVQSLERQANRLTTLVNDLLDVSRINAGRLSLERTTVDLTQLVREILDRFEQPGATAHGTISLVAAEPVVGEWDGNRIDQVITNLVSNAVKYGAGAPVVVTVSRTDDLAILTVRDGGPGLDEKDSERIFQLFERAASENYGGLGLGLWIVRQIVEAHGGTVSVESRAGEGATFTVRLPMTSGGKNQP
jgi:signal transduction histidine kinase